ncbi:MAG: DUF2130 domain-containing protein [Erysipelotrichaceae bacterium]|nr:DUF2130 domain-containing protein [Erysipelotrichaceae bacterium]
MEIKCPNCGQLFKIDDNSYLELIKQIRNDEFEKELEKSKELLISRKESEKKEAVHDLERKYEEKLAVGKLELTRLQQQLQQQEQKVQDAVALAVGEKEKELLQLRMQLQASGNEKALAVKEAEEKMQQKLNDQQQSITELKSQLTNQNNESQLREQALINEYNEKLKFKEEEIERYKEFRLRLSTKMVGESLEQHCQIEFNKLRAAGFETAYFEKDNDASSGSKGDYIFRDYDDGMEYISIMFEMKNEMEDTASKHKNEDFLNKLDRDRNQKKCEYAVLVTTLEPENELYNNGIVDVSYRYPKMYIIRPQFFIPLITILRNSARNSLNYRRQLVTVQNQNIDISNFEKEMNDFKDKFGRNYRLASERFNAAIIEIEKTIQHLEKVKAELMSSDNQLRLANQKAEDLSIKRLTRNNPTMKAKFEELKKGEE